MLAFFGTVFEPASVLGVTSISVSMTVLVRGSLTLQTRAGIKRKLRAMLIGGVLVSWLLPLGLALVFLLKDQYGSDAVYCKHQKNLFVFFEKRVQGWLSPSKVRVCLCCQIVASHPSLG